MVKVSLACGIQKCLGQLWGNDDFSDFTVIVEDKIYRCHQLILRGCSRFFDTLLRSEMRENIEGCTHLRGIKSETFDIIINAVYRGDDGLTQENVVSVWKAVHLLQIDYLMAECEDFVMRNISFHNYLQYYTCAKLLETEKVISLSVSLMISDFNRFKDTETFLDISADELHRIINSTNLKIVSEDSLMESILRWVSHNPSISSIDPNLIPEVFNNMEQISPGINIVLGTDVNQDLTDEMDEVKDDQDSRFSTDNQYDSNIMKLGHSTREGNDREMKTRMKELGKLLSVGRFCLLTPNYLQALLKNPVISTNVQAFKVLFNAYFYQQNIQPNYRPRSAALWAHCDMEHVMVYVDRERRLVKIYSLDKGSTHVLCRLPFKRGSTHFTLAVCDQQLILGESWCILMKFESRIQIWDNHFGWKVTTGSMRTSLTKLLSYGPKFFMISTSPKAAYAFLHGRMWFETVNKPFMVRSMVSCKKYILFLEGEAKDGDFCTAVYCYESQTKQTSKLKNWDGPWQSIVSFSCGENVYILQRNGTLRLVISMDDDDDVNDQTDKVLFEIVAKLWDFNWGIHGAIVYNDELLIFGCPSDKLASWVACFPDNSDFKTVKLIQINSYSECHSMLIPKSWLN